MVANRVSLTDYMTITSLSVLQLALCDTTKALDKCKAALVLLDLSAVSDDKSVLSVLLKCFMLDSFLYQSQKPV